MDLGVAIALFFVAAIVLAILFSLIAVFFSYKFKKARITLYEPYNLIDPSQIDHNENFEDEEYEEFINKRNHQIKLNQIQKNQREKFMFEMTMSNQPLYQNHQGYQIHDTLKQSIHQAKSTVRSMGSHRSFRPDKVNNSQFRQSGEGQALEIINEDSLAIPPKLNDASVKKKEYSFIAAVINYTQVGIQIIERNLQAIYLKENGAVLQQKQSSEKFINRQTANFTTVMEVYGFEESRYCAYLYQCKVSIGTLQANKRYNIENLKISEEKYQIAYEDYCWEKEQIMQ